MKKLLVLSGKGGTGKTTVSAALIKLFDSKVYADCDVDAPNLHLVTENKGTIVEKDYIGSDVAYIDKDKCVECGACEKNCRFNAIKDFTVNDFACEGCAVCEYICPVGAISMIPDVSGKTIVHEGERVLSTAKLKMGRGNSGKLVTEVKKNIPENEGVTIIDGSPGIGCPVIASISGVDRVILVTEPTLSGISDLERIVKTASFFKVPVFVVINKYTISEENTIKIEEYCNKKGIELLGKIPYDNTVSKSINKGKSVIDTKCAATIAIKEIFNKLKVAVDLIN